MSARLTLADRCRGIELLILDVDGVLTAGEVFLGDGALELKAFHVRDGTGLRAWREAGKQAAIITGRTSKAVQTRAEELGIDAVVQGVADKSAAFRRLVAESGMGAEQAGYIGDDLPDLGPMTECGLAVAVADACPEVIAAAHQVTRAAGGRGAVREIIELVLHCQGRWTEALERFRGSPAATSRR